MNKYLSAHAALNDIGLRLKTYRIDSRLTQDELAVKAGVSRRSIQYMERGDDVTFGTIIKVLIALQLDSNLDILVPDSTKRPTYYMNMKSDTPHLRRVKKKNTDAQKNIFRWGDGKS